MIKGITITFVDRIQSDVDELNRPIYTEELEHIDNVLVAPASESEITDTLNLYGRKAIYTLALPKGDSHIWTGKQVEFFGRRWNVIGDCIEGIEDLIPLDWNRKVRVEAING